MKKHRHGGDDGQRGPECQVQLTDAKNLSAVVISLNAGGLRDLLFRNISLLVGKTVHNISETLPQYNKHYNFRQAN